MSAIVFLLLAAALSALGILVLWIRSRPSSSPESSIEEFNAKRRALGGDDPDRTRPGAVQRRRS